MCGAAGFAARTSTRRAPVRPVRPSPTELAIPFLQPERVRQDRVRSAPVLHWPSLNASGRNPPHPAAPEQRLPMTQSFDDDAVAWLQSQRTRAPLTLRQAAERRADANWRGLPPEDEDPITMRVISQTPSRSKCLDHSGALLQRVLSWTGDLAEDRYDQWTGFRDSDRDDGSVDVVLQPRADLLAQQLGGQPRRVDILQDRERDLAVVADSLAHGQVVVTEDTNGDQVANRDQISFRGFLLHGSDVVIGPDVRPAGRTGHRHHEPKAQVTNELAHSLPPSHAAPARGKRRVAHRVVVKERFRYAATAGPPEPTEPQHGTNLGGIVHESGDIASRRYERTEGFGRERVSGLGPLAPARGR